MNSAQTQGGAQALPPVPLDWMRDAIFGTLPPGVLPVVCDFAGNPKSGNWTARPWVPGTAAHHDHNAYFTLATYHPDSTGSYRRLRANCHALHGVMLDDIGTKAHPLSWLDRCPPSMVTQTSPGNYQAIYLFAEPLTDLDQAQALQHALIDAGLCDPNADGPAARWSRLPVGVNGKHSPPTPVMLMQWNPERRYTIAQIVADLELPPPKPKEVRTAAAASVDWAATPEAKRREIIEDLRSALKHLNADDRDGWSDVGQYLKGMGLEGFELWSEWSARSYKWDERAPDQWHTFRGDRSDYRAVFNRATAAGWKNPRRGPLPTEVGFGVNITLPPGASLTPLPPTTAVAVPNEPQRIVPPAFSEDHVAHELAFNIEPRYRWTPGLDWMVNVGTHWKADDELTRFGEARATCRAAAACLDSESEKRRLTSKHTVAAVLSLAQSDQRIVVPTSMWDADPLAVNTPGGVVDLVAGKLRPRGEDLVTQCAAVCPDFSAPTPTFDRFMLDVFGGDVSLVEFMQRVMGYVLTGDRREQVLFFFHGSGANGKSTLVDLVQWMFGSYAIKLPSSALMSSRNEQHPASIAMLRAKRLALSSELDEGQYFNEPLIKELTGDATTTARFMRQNFFEFALSQKHIIVGNHKPRLRGGDPAMARRILMVPFVQVFTKERQDRTLLDKLKREAPGVMAWAVRGAIAWGRQGLGVPECVRAASVEYLAEHDDVQTWIDDRCVFGGETKAADLYSDFKIWKQQRGEIPPTQTTFGDRLQKKPSVTRRVSNGVRYGLTLRPIPWTVG